MTVATQIGDVVPGVVPLTFAGVGVVLVLRVPDNRMGALFTTIAVLWGAAILASSVANRGWGADALARFVFAWTFFPGLALVLGPVPLLFPDGLPPSPRWSYAPWLAASFALLAAVGNSLPEGAALGGTLADLAGFPALATVAVSVAAVGVRYRRAGTIRRLQLRWFLFAVALLPVTIAVADASGSHPALQSLVVTAGLVPLPVAVSVAITRHRLYEIDRIVRRTVTYALVTAVLVNVYAAVAVLPSMLFDLRSDLLVAAATLGAAAAFGPVHRRVQTVVDRRFDRARYDAVRVVERFGARLRGAVGLDQVAADVRGVVGATVQPAHVSVWLRGREDDR